MNIFFLDRDVKKCVEYHSDKHIVKMSIEYNQLLCSVHHMSGQSSDLIPYKLTHKNHPCSIWARESLSNYLYLCELALESCREYTHRYGKRHKSQDVVEWCIVNKVNIPDKGFTDPPKAMPDDSKLPDVVDSYRNYYMKHKSHFCKWKNRVVPEWFKKI